MLGVGVIGSPHGIKGEVKLLPHRELKSLAGLEIYLQDPKGATRRFYVIRERRKRGVIILKLQGCDDRNEAETLRGSQVRAPEEVLEKLGPDEYLIEDIIGIEVFTVEGSPVGIVEEVLKTGANDVYVVSGHMIPAVRQIVREIDMKKRRMVIEPIEGMI